MRSPSWLLQLSLLAAPLFRHAEGQEVVSTQSSGDSPNGAATTIFIPEGSAAGKMIRDQLSGNLSSYIPSDLLGLIPRQYLTIDLAGVIPQLLTYQISPYYKPAAVLKQGTGSVVTTLDRQDANLGGRGQSVVSQRKKFCSSEPIRLFSGFGDVATVLVEDIFFPGGVIHITDRPFTIPQTISQTLSKVDKTAANILANGLPAFDDIPSITSFIPTGSSLVAALGGNCVLSASDAINFLNAHIVQHCVDYSPQLVDGAFFEPINTKDITITVQNNTKYANKAEILKQDIVLRNGVTHIIDRPLVDPGRCVSPPPPTSRPPPPPPPPSSRPPPPPPPSSKPPPPPSSKPPPPPPPPPSSKPPPPPPSSKPPPPPPSSKPPPPPSSSKPPPPKSSTTSSYKHTTSSSSKYTTSSSYKHTTSSSTKSTSSSKHYSTPSSTLSSKYKPSSTWESKPPPPKSTTPPKSSEYKPPPKESSSKGYEDSWKRMA